MPCVNGTINPETTVVWCVVVWGGVWYGGWGGVGCGMGDGVVWGG